MLEIVDKEFATSRYESECPAAYLAIIRGFLAEKVVERMADIRKTHRMFEALERNDEWDEDTDLSMGASGMLI